MNRAMANLLAYRRMIICEFHMQLSGKFFTYDYLKYCNRLKYVEIWK
jgi:hypothetical protein